MLAKLEYFQTPLPEQSNRRWKSHQDIEATKGRTTGSTTEINPSVVVKAKTIVKFAGDVKILVIQLSLLLETRKYILDMLMRTTA